MFLESEPKEFVKDPVEPETRSGEDSMCIALSPAMMPTPTVPCLYPDSELSALQPIT